MKEFKLSAPIMAHGQKMHVLEIREPTFDEVEDLGFPFTIISGGGFKIDSGAAFKYIPVLAGIPRSSAQKIPLSDLFKISMSIMGFFTASGTATDSADDVTTSLTSGE